MVQKCSKCWITFNILYFVLDQLCWYLHWWCNRHSEQNCYSVSIKEVAPKSASVYVLQYLILSGKKKQCKFILRIVLVKQEKVVAIQFWSLNLWIFNFQCDKMERTHKHFCYTLMWSRYELNYLLFSWGTIFIWKHNNPQY